MKFKVLEQFESDIAWLLCGGVALAILACLAGCSTAPRPDQSVYSPLPMTASAVDKAAAHVSSADSLVKQAKPSADKTGQALLTAATGEHDKATSALKDAKTELAAAVTEKNSLIKAEEAKAAELAKVEHGWGYRLQVIVHRLFILLCVLVALHLALVAAGLFLPPPYSVACSFAGKIINPLGWVVAAADHLHLNRCQEQKEALLACLPPKVINDGIKTA